MTSNTMNTRSESEYWRSGCECNRSGLCFRCRAADKIERQAAAINRLRSAIEDYLEGESQGSVTGLREAMRATDEEVSKPPCSVCCHLEEVHGPFNLQHVFTVNGGAK